MIIISEALIAVGIPRTRTKKRIEEETGDEVNYDRFIDRRIKGNHISFCVSRFSLANQIYGAIFTTLTFMKFSVR